MEERRKLLERNVKEIKNHIMLSETNLIQVTSRDFLAFNDRTKDDQIFCHFSQDKAALSDLMMKAIDEGLEGLVMKDLKVY